MDLGHVIRSGAGSKSPQEHAPVIWGVRGFRVPQKGHIGSMGMYV